MTHAANPVGWDRLRTSLRMSVDPAFLSREFRMPLRTIQILRLQLDDEDIARDALLIHPRFNFDQAYQSLIHQAYQKVFTMSNKIQFFN
jgi:hypothetical protein